MFSWMWASRGCESFVFVLPVFWSVVDFGEGLARRCGGGESGYLRQLCAIYSLRRCSEIAAFVFSSDLASVCLGFVERSERQVIQEYS